MKSIHLLPVIGLLALSTLLGCKSRGMDKTKKDKDVVLDSTGVIRQEGDGFCRLITKGEAGDSDMISGLSSNINGDCLELKVSYGGGCQEHGFDLMWGGYHAESMPPQVTLKLIHRANGDNCRAMLNEKLSYDLRPLRYNGVGQVIINIAAPGQDLQRANYTYQP